MSSNHKNGCFLYNSTVHSWTINVRLYAKYVDQSRKKERVVKQSKFYCAGSWNILLFKVQN
jgi:hypothetical protein